MRISVFGLGYVGVVSAACLVEAGHSVVGIDPNTTKVDLLNAGRSPIIEERVSELIAAGVADGRLRATTSCAEAVSETQLAFVCVGTPSQANGSLELRYLRRVSEELGAALAETAGRFVVVVRSTVLPGTTRSVVVPALEEGSGLTVGDGLGLCYQPEFLREGSAVRDFYEPPKVVIGSSDPESLATVRAITPAGGAPVLEVPIEVAELAKYADNSWHALKVAFANEIGSLSKELGIDGRAVMDVFVQDTKLNLSASYLKPGFAFGGSCLPKDVRALTHRGRTADLDLPLLNAVIPSNERHLDRAFHLIVAAGSRRVGVLGLSFKAGTDDLRESPMVDIVERLIGKGYELRIFDGNVNLAALTGANRDYILNQIPHIAELMVPTIEEALDHGETIVVGNGDEAFAKVPGRLREGQRVVDFVRVGGAHDDPAYEGLCW